MKILPMLRIGRPQFSRDEEISKLERRMNSDLERLMQISTDTRITWMWNNFTARLRLSGKLLPRREGE